VLLDELWLGVAGASLDLEAALIKNFSNVSECHASLQYQNRTIVIEREVP
jgi:hypothetical protein